MKLDKLVKYWPIAGAIVAVLVGFGTLTSVVAENAKANDKQDEAIEKITDLQREQAQTNGRIESQVKDTKRDVERILDILLDNQRRDDQDNQ